MVTGKSVTLNPVSDSDYRLSPASLNQVLLSDQLALQNNLGQFLATAIISLNLGNLDYTITGIVSASSIDITANNITNQGNVTASDFIKLNAAGSSASGEGNITNYGTLSAVNYLNLISDRFISNYGTISANNLTLTSNWSEIYNYGNIRGGSGTTTLSSSNANYGILHNYGVITADSDMLINAKFVDNFNEISAANDLTINAYDNLINNPTALIWSGNNATFNVANTFLNNQADIYADNNLTIRKNTSLDKTTLVQNISGNIETYAGDIAIIASTLTNQRTSMKTQNYSYWQSGCYYHNWECHFDSSYTASISGSLGANSSIDSGGNVSLTLGTLNNDSSSILAVKDIAIDAEAINNTSHTFESYQNWSYDWWNCCNPYGWLSTYKPANMYSESYPAYIKAGGSITVTQSGSPNPTFVNGTNVTQNSAVGGNIAQSHSTNINNINAYNLGQTGVINVDLSSITNAISNNSRSASGSDLGMETASTSSPTSVSPSTVHKR